MDGKQYSMSGPVPGDSVWSGVCTKVCKVLEVKCVCSVCTHHKLHFLQ